MKIVRGILITILTLNRFITLVMINSGKIE